MELDCLPESPSPSASHCLQHGQQHEKGFPADMQQALGLRHDLMQGHAFEGASAVEQCMVFALAMYIDPEDLVRQPRYARYWQQLSHSEEGTWSTHALWCLYGPGPCMS